MLFQAIHKIEISWEYQHAHIYQFLRGRGWVGISQFAKEVFLHNVKNRCPVQNKLESSMLEIFGFQQLPFPISHESRRATPMKYR